MVTSDVASGATSIPIYPAIVGPVGGQPQQYQTVDALPANNATVTLVTPASGSYRQNFIYAKQAVTMVTADLEMPPNVKGPRADGRHFDAFRRSVCGGTDQTIDRLDILFGWLFVRPEWACIVCDRVGNELLAKTPCCR